MGRWGLLFAACAKFRLCSPILTSAIAIALFTLGIVALIDKLGIRNACLRYASSVLFIASPFVSCCITYYYCSNSYALSFLCAVLAACLIGRVGAVGKPVALVGAVALLAFSLGCYQASLGVFCVAVLLVMVRSLLNRWRRWHAMLVAKLRTPTVKKAAALIRSVPSSLRCSSALSLRYARRVLCCTTC